MPARIPDLERLMKELKTFTDNACKVEPGQDKDPVSDMCNDAYLMLEQAREELLRKKKDGE